jgi:hypothetical protein
MKYLTKEQAENLNNTLEVGKEYTIIQITDFGFTSESHIKLVSSQIKPYAQYNDSVQLIFKVKNKRLSRNNAGFNFHGVKTMAVYEGWHNLKDSVNSDNILKDNSEVKVTQAKYSCFDRRNLTDIIDYHEKQGIKPIFAKVD